MRLVPLARIVSLSGGHRSRHRSGEVAASQIETQFPVSGCQDPADNWLHHKRRREPWDHGECIEDHSAVNYLFGATLMAPPSLKPRLAILIEPPSVQPRKGQVMYVEWKNAEQQ